MSSFCESVPMIASALCFRPAVIAYQPQGMRFSVLRCFSAFFTIVKSYYKPSCQLRSDWSFPCVLSYQPADSQLDVFSFSHHSM